MPSSKMSPALAKAMGGSNAKNVPKKQLGSAGGSAQQRQRQEAHQQLEQQQMPQQLHSPPAPLMGSQQMPMHPGQGYN